MSQTRRQFVASAAAAGTGLVAASALFSRPNEAAAQFPAVAPVWANLELGKTYKVVGNGPGVVITVLLSHKEGDFRGAIHGKVDNQVRGMAAAGWSPASGISCNSFMMIANRGQQFAVFIADDFAKNYGRAWTAEILVSDVGAVQKA